MRSSDSITLPTRGPVEHERREQIIQIADEYFRHYGYAKTTVADLAKQAGVSSAYIYKFFESKQAIGEAVCARTLARIDAALFDIAESDQSATMRLRKVLKCLVDKGFELFFNERRLHEIVVASVTMNWCANDLHKAAMARMIKRIIVDGREAGEFERKTPLDEVCRAILDAMTGFSSPLLLQQKDREELEESVVAVGNLILRSLAG